MTLTDRAVTPTDKAFECMCANSQQSEVDCDRSCRSGQSGVDILLTSD